MGVVARNNTDDKEGDSLMVADFIELFGLTSAEKLRRDMDACETGGGINIGLVIIVLFFVADFFTASSSRLISSVFG